MTTEEIRGSKNECDDGTWECARWLQEIAAQLAEANAAQRSRAEQLDTRLAEAKAEAQGKCAFLDELMAELKPLIPKIAQLFDPPPQIDYPVALASSAFLAGSPVVIVPPIPDTRDGALLAYLRSKGHDDAKATQILGNHREQVQRDMIAEQFAKGVSSVEEEKEAAPAQEERAVPQA